MDGLDNGIDQARALCRRQTLNLHAHDGQEFFTELFFGQLAAVLVELIVSGDLEVDVRFGWENVVHLRMVHDVFPELSREFKLLLSELTGVDHRFVSLINRAWYDRQFAFKSSIA
ncbi:MAG TPA: hypothetical protein VMV69_03045 [Pirellulales bacterium]|nr:hypothetical protein [Pirellulales bacterium]